MPRYRYTARSLEGQEKKGTMEALDAREIAQKLHQEGLLLVDAALDEAKEGFKFSFQFFGVSLKDKIFFTKNLQVMVASGLSLPRALSILALQAKNQDMKKALEKIQEEINKGKTFSESLSLYPGIFNDFFKSMVKVGEETGTLDKVLGILNNQMDKEYELNSKIKGAMVYPAVIIVTMILIGILMLVVVVPKLAQTFEELKVELPMTTQMVVTLGNFFLSYWYIAIILVFAIAFLFRIVKKTEKGKRFFDGLAIKVPIFSSIVKNVNSAYTLRNLSSLIGAGVSLPRALEISAGTMGNIYYAVALESIKEKVKTGSKFSDAIKEYQHLYPISVIQMIAVGEETGETSQILSKLADFYENEVSEATKNLASIVEPVLMLIIGGVVGFFAISMVQPMYSMLDAI